MLSWQPCAHLASPYSTPPPTAVGARVRPLQARVHFSALQNPGFWHPEEVSELDTQMGPICSPESPVIGWHSFSEVEAELVPEMGISVPLQWGALRWACWGEVQKALLPSIHSPGLAPPRPHVSVSFNPHNPIQEVGASSPHFIGGDTEAQQDSMPCPHQSSESGPKGPDPAC